ncbi:MAG: heme ABC exporter ATP-binding protein CcmA [Vicinamibacteria bacterium]|jgi:heme ABC exporter ATP-binding subunit CcmA|nr:heme ABC exporter ATP-binding protein CcmA [Vicinamibacteria bacterium]
MTGELALDARGLARRYGGRWALAGVSFTLGAGQALALVGRNGSGKSTLLRLLSAALKVHAGEALVCGADLRRDADAVRRRTALLSHAAYTWEALSARENLVLASRLLDQDRPQERALRRLEEVGLAGRADDPVSSFSAGMRKRLALARTLLQEAPLVMLDEPYGALDPPGFRLIDGIVRALRAEGRSVVMATHQVERGATLCDRGLVLEQGRVAWEGPAAELPANSGLLRGSEEGA